MPTSTFFHLPEEKREKLLQAARREFARAPYADVSINRIIHAAGIPRGSFYMYFADKEDLFLFLTGEYGQRLTGLMDRLLKRREGDLFGAFQDLFDFVMDYCRGPEADGTITNLVDIFRRNAGVRHDTLLPSLRPEALIGRFASAVDADRLFLRKPGDLSEIIHVLMGVTGQTLSAAIQSEHPEAERARYRNLLEILKRGMAKGPAD